MCNFYLFDFQKEYDSIHRDMLWKLINMRKTCVQKTRSAIRIDGTLSSFFENKTELKQGNSVITSIIQLSITKSDTKYRNGS